jgi:hypothetical protein
MNFVTILTANAARWDVAPALVTALGNLGTAYEDAYVRRFMPDAGRVSVERKNLALAALKRGVQDMVNGHINHNPNVAPDDRVLLGLYIYAAGKGPVSPPFTTVVLRIAMNLIRQLTVYVTDSATPDKRGRPYEALSVEVVYAILSSPPADIDALTRSISTTRPPLTLIFREEDRGKTVYMAGRWKGRGQAAGPWCAIISAIIP